MQWFDLKPATLSDVLTFAGLVVTIVTLLAIFLQVRVASDQLRQNRDVEKARFLQDLMAQLLLGGELRKFWLRVDYGDFEFDAATFVGSDEELWLDALLYTYDYVGYLLKMNIITLEEVSLLGFSVSRLLEQSNAVQEYLAWLANDFKRLKMPGPPHPDARYLVERLRQHQETQKTGTAALARMAGRTAS